MDATVTRRRSSSGPAAIKTCTTLCQPKGEDTSASASLKADEDLTLSAEGMLSDTECAISSSGSETNTSCANSRKPHSSLTTTTPSRNTVFCCTTRTVIHMKQNSPEDITAIDAFLSHADGKSITDPGDFHAHIIVVRNAEPSKEVAGHDMYLGRTRYYGLAHRRKVTTGDTAAYIIADGGQSKLQYTQIFPTSHLLSSFKQTGLLALRCDIHGGMWYEVGVLRYSAGDEEDGSVEEEVGKEVKDALEDEPYKVIDDTNENTANTKAETSGEVAEPADSSATAKAPETQAQRKNDKRRANEESKKKDNQRRMKQKKKAAAAKRAAKGAGSGVAEAGTVAEIVKGETGIEEDNRGVVEKETDNEGQKTNGWWFCAVM